MVEFAFISLVLMFFIFFLADLVLRQAVTGRLDRVSYSASGVLRERIQLYDSRERLNQQDVEQIRSLAQRMMRDMDPTMNTAQLQLQVEELHFVEPSYFGGNQKTISLYRRWHSGAFAGQCQPARPLNQLTELTPKGSYGRWVPLYQVTVCIPTISWFSRLINGQDPHPMMSSYAVVMAR